MQQRHLHSRGAFSNVVCCAPVLMHRSDGVPQIILHSIKKSISRFKIIYTMENEITLVLILKVLNVYKCPKKIFSMNLPSGEASEAPSGPHYRK